MSEKMGEVIYINFETGASSPASTEDSFVFSRAVNLLAQLGVDHLEAREALSFLTEYEQIEALQMAEDKVRLDLGKTTGGLVANAVDAYINNDPGFSRLLLALSPEESDQVRAAVIEIDSTHPPPEAS